MRPHVFIALGLGAITIACNAGPVAPTIVRGPAAPAVSTVRPGVWDSRDELTAWVTNGVSSGPAAVAGDDESVIRIDVPGGANLKLRSPAFDPPVNDLQTIRLRYRWLDGTGGRYGTNGQYLSIDLYLQTPTVAFDRVEPWLFIVVPSRQGAWIEQDFTPNASYKPPFSALSASISMCGVCGEGSGKGKLEIDWIALVRSSR